VRIEKLASTGEGITRTPEGVGFIDRALPGELVATSIYARRRTFWRGSLRAVLEPSPDRVGGVHAPCAGCDWAHYEPAAARRSKGELFLETMQRIGRLSPAPFGEPSVVPGGAGYRLRTRLHALGRGSETRVGYFAPGTHRVVEADACEAIAAATRALLPHIRDSIGDSGAAAAEAALLEDIAGHLRLIRVTASASPGEADAMARRLADHFEGVRIRSPEGPILVEHGPPRLAMDVGARSFRVSVDAFFQGNRHLTSTLAGDVEDAARRVPAGEALDAFGGVGLFAGALLSAGHRVISVELDPEALADAGATHGQWPDRGNWALVASDVAGFLGANRSHFDVVVVDPPRAGLGTGLAAELARRARRLFLYVSCDPATLARDLPAILAEGLEIRATRLYDLFPFTHRVEALVALERGA
jgi:23S rRNA (uracil1939-C5)-methyltransferase